MVPNLMPDGEIRVEVRVLHQSGGQCPHPTSNEVSMVPNLMPDGEIRVEVRVLHQSGGQCPHPIPNEV